MQGSILDFLKLATEKPELASELVNLARKYDFEFSDEVSDEELDGVAGGGTVKVIMSSLTGGGLPDGLTNPTESSTPPSGRWRCGEVARTGRCTAGSRRSSRINSS